MPAPLAAAAISTGGNMLTSAFNAAMTAQQNKQMRGWNEHMYRVQRQDALTDYDKQRRDSLADFTMQNQYDSPTEQMNRLREAGLNPNLVYGSGASAGSPAPVKSADTRSTSPGSYSPHAPQIPDFVGPGLSSYYDTQIKQATIDNLKTQNTVQTQEAILKAAQTSQTVATTENTSQNTATSKFDLGMKTELRQNSLDFADQNLKKMMGEADTSLGENDRRNALNSSSIREAAQRILTQRLQNTAIPGQKAHIQSQIQSINRDIQIKDLDIQLKKLGIQPGDPLYMRALGRIINSNDVKITNPLTNNPFTHGDTSEPYRSLIKMKKK
jgi:hypothetical protein